jgi:predicted amidophosphoribosyltransferase
MTRPFALIARAALEALLPRACAACEAAADGPLCARCSLTLVDAPPNAPALLGFGAAVQRAVNAAKQGPDLVRAEALARLFVERAPARLDVDAIAFVPAPLPRLLRRGFDLPAVLAHAIGKARGLPVRALLEVTRWDRPLSAGAGREARALLVKNRYRVRAPVEGLRVLLVDDVYTTGATLGEAGRVLVEAGAVVTPLALAAKP